MLLYARISQLKLCCDYWNKSLMNLANNTIKSCVYTLLSTKPEFSTALNLSLAKHAGITWLYVPEKTVDVLIRLYPN